MSCLGSNLALPLELGLTVLNLNHAWLIPILV